MNCQICQTENIAISWTDTHGVAQCTTCGAPYRIYHYEGEGPNRCRVDRPPELCYVEKYIPLFQTYWQEVKRPMPSGHSFGFGSHEVATEDDVKQFYAWLEKNANKYES